ncbi:IS1634 family transposase [Succinatimonas hippei]|uniref:IS1634 family transposase n=1 Tax=Succinatimonas hippei TaxID=626938 RepID=UPI0023F8896B|nr:IS1634 family transposase [Succinatimonas hippei]
MAFRLKVTKTNGREYAAIVENIYSKQRHGSSSKTVRTYGDLVKLRCKNPNIDEEIRQEVARLNSDAEAANQAWVKRHLQSIDLVRERALKQVNYGIAFYRKIWESLKLHTWFDRTKRNSRGIIKYDLDQAVFLLAAMRILRPMSKSKTFSARDELVFDFTGLTLDDIYHSLDVLADKKKTVISNLNKNLEAIYARVKTIAFYDVTTFYFESFDSDELRARGMSKENKTNEVQVVLGLLVDGEGIPLDYELFRGNTSEMNTIIEVVNNYKTQNNLQGVTVVADRGLNSHLNLKSLTDLNFDYIVAQSVNRLPGSIKEKVFSDDNWDEVFVSSDFQETFKVKTLDQSSSPELDNKIIVTWSAKRQAHDLKVLNERIEKCRQLVKRGTGAVNASIKHGVRQFLQIKKGAKIEYSSNEKLYEKRRKQAGYYALISSHKNTDAMQIYRDLRRLWHIEECFRVMKTNLDACPVYVWTPKKIRGHFLVCYLALVMERLAHYRIEQAGIDLSGEQVIEMLGQAKMTILEQDKSKKTLYLKQGISANTEKNNAYSAAVDELMRVVGIDPPAAIEDSIGLARKMKVSSNMKLVI